MARVSSYNAIKLARIVAPVGESLIAEKKFEIVDGAIIINISFLGHPLHLKWDIGENTPCKIADTTE